MFILYSLFGKLFLTIMFLKQRSFKNCFLIFLQTAWWKPRLAHYYNTHYTIFFLADPDDADAESPRTSLVVRGTGYGVGGVTPAPPLEEDLSLVLGTMQVSRGRSYSTTVTPKLPLQPLQQGEGHKEVQRTASVGGDVTKSAVVRRKKSVPVSTQESR